LDALGWLPDWLVVLFIAMIPFIELRGSIPVAILVYDMPVVETVALSVIGNMIPVPFILWYAPAVERWFRRFGWWDRALDRLFKRTRRRARSSVVRYGPMVLLLFVAIPFPTTGAWTGSLIAYLFDLDKRRSLVVVFIGVLIAGAIVGAIVLGAALIGWALALGLVVAVVVMALAARRIEGAPGDQED
jgi:uncharacterized membrane protein